MTSVPAPPAFIPGTSPATAYPFARFLPPLPEGVANLWLGQRVAPGSWLLDPFGAAPQLAVEAARGGYRLLVALNNPILRLVLEMLANPPGEAELRAALAALASARIREERIEPHIRKLYATSCNQCQTPIQAEAFLWQAGAQAPMAKFYTCPQCGDAGERQVSEADLVLAQRHAQAGPHRARALERVAPLNDPDRVYVEEALAVYPPRAVYALITLINKLDGIHLPPAQLRIVHAMLLVAFDQGNTLWPHPTTRERPRQLTIPPLYREQNLWSAIEQAFEVWARPGTPRPVTTWPDLPPESGGICIYEGPLRDLASEALELPWQAVLTGLPRPNQAFWTLSALWAGWLWGPATLKGFKSVLRRQRYGWGWHTSALQAALEHLPRLLPAGTPAFALLGESEPGFLAAAILAGRLAGLENQGLALRGELAQITWQTPFQQLPELGQNPDAAAGVTAGVTAEIEAQLSQAARELLQQAGEPQPFLPLYAAGLQAWSTAPRVPGETNPAELHSLFQNCAQNAFSYRQGFLRYKGSEKNPFSGFWWIQAAPAAGGTQHPALSDQVEMQVVGQLLQHPGIEWAELEARLCAALPGLLPPQPKLMRACLESYAELAPTASGREHFAGGWYLRAADLPARRRADLDQIAGLLKQLGNRLGFLVRQPDKAQRIFEWMDAQEVPVWRFYLSASALLSKIASQARPDRVRQVVLLPGSRANLVAFKLAQNPYLENYFEQDWQLIKFRHFRRLGEESELNLARFTQQLPLDPLTYSEPQLRML